MSIAVWKTATMATSTDADKPGWQAVDVVRRPPVSRTRSDGYRALQGRTRREARGAKRVACLQALAMQDPAHEYRIPGSGFIGSWPDDAGSKIELFREDATSGSFRFTLVREVKNFHR